MRKKNASTFVPALVKSDGNITTSQDKVASEFINSYKTFLETDNEVTNTSNNLFEAGFVLTDEDCSILLEPIDDMMIKDALFILEMLKPQGLMVLMQFFLNRTGI